MPTLQPPYDEKWVKADFQEWSGGFPPESDHQITVYVEHTLPGEVDEAAARQFLQAWMNESAKDD